MVCREYFKSVAAPKLFLGSGPLAKLIVERCPILQEPYWPAPLAFSAHAQTMLTGAHCSLPYSHLLTSMAE